MLGLCTDYCLILSATDAVTLYSIFCRSNTPQAGTQFPWLFPDYFQIPRLLHVFQVGGHPTVRFQANNNHQFGALFHNNQDKLVP